MMFQMAMFTIVKSWRHRNNIKIFDHYDDNMDLVDKKSLHRSRLDLYAENDLEQVIFLKKSIQNGGLKFSDVRVVYIFRVCASIPNQGVTSGGVGHASSLRSDI